MTPELNQALKKFNIDPPVVISLMTIVRDVVSLPFTETVDTYDEIHGVYLTLNINTTPAHAVALYMDFLDLMLGLGLLFPHNLHISFNGTQI